jgi:hypothetical protein
MVDALKLLLIEYENLSGLKINFNKSEITIEPILTRRQTMCKYLRMQSFIIPYYIFSSTIILEETKE